MKPHNGLFHGDLVHGELPVGFLSLGVALLLLAGCAGVRNPQDGPAAVAEAAAPPSASVDSTVTEIHGLSLSDDYFWLRERESDEVIAYLEEENRYTEAVMAHTEELQGKLYDELLGRIKEDDADPPYRHGDFLYYSRTEEGKPYRIYCRKPAGDEGAEEQVLLDVNALAEGHEFFEIGAMAISPNHEMLAYGFDTTGSEDYVVVVKDLVSGELLEDRIEGAASSLEWANDNETLFYTVRDEARRPYKVYRHRLGNVAGLDELVFHESDEKFFVGVGKTRSERYLLIELGSSTTSEIRYLDASEPEGDFTLFAPRQHEVEYSVSHCGDHFYVRTNEEAKNFRLLRAATSNVDRSAWEEVVPHRAGVKLETVQCFEGFMVLRERVEGQRKLRVRHYDGGDDHHVELPETVYAVGFAANPEYRTDRYRFTYTSLVTPSTVYEYEPAARELEVLKRREVLGGYDPSQYVTERIFATAEDGARVPMSLVYRRGLVKNGKNPCLLYAYGSYGATLDPRFSSLNLSLLDRGFVYAIAHIRGGQASWARRWYDDGKLLDQEATPSTDFIDAGEYLDRRELHVARTSSSPLGVAAPGGVLMGAVVEHAPGPVRRCVHRPRAVRRRHHHHDRRLGHSR